MKIIKNLKFAALAALAVTLLFQTSITRVAAAAPEFSDWLAPVNLGPSVNSTNADQGPAVSNDGLSLYLTVTDRPGGYGGVDIWVSQRANVGDPWGQPTNLGPTINTTATEGIPAFSRDGHWMYFNSDRPGGFGGSDLWASWRTNIHDDFGWQAAVNLGPGVNTASFDCCSTFFENEEAGTPLLFFTRDVLGAGDRDIYVSAQAADGSFGPATLVPELNSPQAEVRPTIRFDGLEMFLFSNRPGSLGLNDLWTSTRQTVFDTWSPPVNLGPTINSTANESGPYLSSDGRVLFFNSDRPGGFGLLDLYVTTRSVKPPPLVMTIRASQVEVCWNSTSNLTYQVQYSSALTTNLWTSLVDCVRSTNSTSCIYDPVVVGQPQRFYRVVQTNCVPAL